MGVRLTPGRRRPTDFSPEPNAIPRALGTCDVLGRP